LPEAFIELPDQEAIEPHAVLEQPEEGASIHHRQARIAQRHDIVAPGLVLEHGSLAKPCPGGQARKTGGLAATGHDAHPGKAANDAGPVFEAVASHKDVFIGAVGFLDDTGTRNFGLPLIQFARPGRDALQVICSNHALLNRPSPTFVTSSCCIATMLPVPYTSGKTPNRRLTKFAGELSGPRHFKVPLYPMEDHRG